MIGLDDELAMDYLSECCLHLSAVETDLLAMEAEGSKTDEELVNRVFRAIHSVKGGAGFFDLVKVREVAHMTEDVLSMIRSHQIVATPARVRVLLQAVDRLREMLENPGASNQADIAGIASALSGLVGESRPGADAGANAAGRQTLADGRRLRTLLVEDDFASRLLLQTFLSRYGECHIAVNGQEAVEAFGCSLERSQPYDLICMDIMMPEMDGREAVRQVRAMEEARGVRSTVGAKIVMTTAVTDIKTVIRCFRELCDGYLMKPVDLGELLRLMKCYHLAG